MYTKTIGKCIGSFCLLIQGFTVFAGFLDEHKSYRLKDECSSRLHVLRLDINSETDIKEAYNYINRNLPSGAPGKIHD